MPAGIQGAEKMELSLPLRFPRAVLLGPLMLAAAVLLALLLTSPSRAGSVQTVAMLSPSAMRSSDRHLTAQDCAACHVVDQTFSHPTGMAASFKVPAAFPLDDGKVTCTTCHLDTFADHTRELARKNRMLRAPEITGTAWCAQCHSSFETSRLSEHPIAVRRAHTPGAFKPNALTGNATNVAAAYAETSRSCLGCHDGTVSVDGFPRRGAGGVANHPVDIAYRNSTAGTALVARERNMNPRSELDSRIHLVNDQVSCTSCHSLYSPQAKLLVMRNDNSALCINCHAMK
jgi:predicted CXXCH cytochrome family protein